MVSPSELITIVSYMGAAVSIGLGAIGPAAGIGTIGGLSLQGMGENPKMETPILKTMLVGMAIAETTAVYALVVAVLLIFVVTQGR